MAITTVFFDWGGVIAPDPQDDFLSSLLKQAGASDDQITNFFSSYMSRFTRGTLNTNGFWYLLKNTYQLSAPDDLTNTFATWRGLNVADQLLTLVRDLKVRGFKVVLFTNVIEPSYDLIKQAGYYDEFDEVIASCKVGFGKPDQEIYDIALQKTHVTAEESLFVDDKQTFLDPAIRMGFTTILATSSEQIIRDVNAALLFSK